ncbi:oxidoreductase [Cryobacterium melibiosiphilum]|uniref:Oxidoreductase n=1 Tax=Cryobacterium melibiosiphilum TaxID=995039 RepID=A0A3A5MLD9_9MICO|nr:MDR family oxidoreductase [Cryobacterium melibiosiphilum]RJT87918.1 oxidoreductase [Cryobacterium melibiosiphilum]
MGAETQFRAIVVDKATDAAGNARQTAALRVVGDGFLMPGDVTIAVEYSSLNYKDALALMGRPGVARVWPLIAGVDLVGTVEASADVRWNPGDRVILTGAGSGENHHGGLAERARVAGDALVRLPDSLSAVQAAAIGTAGFTAQLAVLALEHGGLTPANGLTPASGPVLVTGGTGGVGSIAISLLARLGYEVHATTGRPEALGAYLHGLGATEIVERRVLATTGRPLQKQRWAGAIDSLGSSSLASVLAQMHANGVVAACGLAQGADLPTSVMPFILRGVSLIGINSVDASRELREQAWARLARDLDLDVLDGLTTTLPLGDSLLAAQQILAGQHHGRTIVDVRA